MRKNWLKRANSKEYTQKLAENGYSFTIYLGIYLGSSMERIK